MDMDWESEDGLRFLSDLASLAAALGDIDLAEGFRMRAVQVERALHTGLDCED